MPSAASFFSRPMVCLHETKLNVYFLPFANEARFYSCCCCVVCTWDRGYFWSFLFCDTAKDHILYCARFLRRLAKPEEFQIGQVKIDDERVSDKLPMSSNL